MSPSNRASDCSSDWSLPGRSRKLPSLNASGSQSPGGFRRIDLVVGVGIGTLYLALLLTMVGALIGDASEAEKLAAVPWSDRSTPVEKLVD